MDHIPNEKIVIEIIKDLKRISKKLYLFEPYVEGVCGDVSYFHRYQIEDKYNLKENLENNGKRFAKNSFLWNYDGYLKSLNLDFKKEPFPLHSASLGPFYQCYEINW